MRDVVDLHLDAVLVAPLGGELVEPDVVGRDEVAPRENAEGRALQLRGRLARVGHRQERGPRHTGPRHLEETAAAGRGVFGLDWLQVTHRLTSLRGNRDRRERLGVWNTPLVHFGATR